MNSKINSLPCSMSSFNLLYLTNVTLIKRL
uniref:Uncharacterized protein n=1 Tax=Podoviridae sp. ctuQh21 TaxID=2825284 RepID=A0A8S5PGI2_9CAUD|nr:MAG TPA: hypothetical protein [Podoviridae sp. ctuQh21]